MRPALYSRMDMNRAVLRRAVTFARPPRVEKPSLGSSSLNLPGGFGRPALSISRICAKRSGAVAGYAHVRRFNRPVFGSLLLSVGVCGSLAGATAPVFSIWLRPMSIPGSPPSVRCSGRKTARFFRARLTFPRTRHAAKPSRVHVPSIAFRSSFSMGSQSHGVSDESSTFRG